jgi:hypothetical protein
MRARVERPLDEPLLSPGDTDKRAGALGRDGVVELQETDIIISSSSTLSEIQNRKIKQNTSANLIIILIRDQPVLAINEDPAEAVGVLGSGAEDGLCDAGAGEAVNFAGQSMCPSNECGNW